MRLIEQQLSANFDATAMRIPLRHRQSCRLEQSRHSAQSVVLEYLHIFCRWWRLLSPSMRPPVSVPVDKNRLFAPASVSARVVLLKPLLRSCAIARRHRHRSSSHTRPQLCALEAYRDAAEFVGGSNLRTSYNSSLMFGSGF